MVSVSQLSAAPFVSFCCFTYSLFKGLLLEFRLKDRIQVIFALMPFLLTQ